MPSDAFFFAGEPSLNRDGILCLHGFTSSPGCLSHLGTRLSQEGWTVYAPRLPGHGTTPNDLAHCRWQDWADAVADAVTAMRKRCDRLIAVGQSMGGLLALHHAARFPGELAAIASLAAPLWLPGIAAKLARWVSPGGWLRGSLHQIPKFGGPDVSDPEAKKTDPSYRTIPAEALAEFSVLMNMVRAELEHVHIPVLVVHGEQDHTAPVACAEELARRTGATLKKVPRSFHLLASDVERDEVATSVCEFAHSIFHAKPTIA